MRSDRRFRNPTSASAELILECAAAIEPPEDLERWYRAYSSMHATRLAIDVDILLAHVSPGARVLDIGAAPLILTLALKKRGFDVTAIDLDPERFAHVINDNQLAVTRCDIEVDPLPFPSASYDAVVFNEVFEHLRINPVAALREIRRVLRPGGELFLSTPNLRSLNGLWNLLAHGRSFAVGDNVFDEYRKLERLGHMGHVREYAPGDIQVLLDRLGFTVDALVFRGRQRNRAAEAFCRVRPEFRRFVSFVAEAVEGEELRSKAENGRAGAATAAESPYLSSFESLRSFSTRPSVCSSGQ